jgi:NAD dependent epimerase/dehydratase family enzyme
MSTVLLTGQRAVPRRLEGAGYRFSYPDLRSALKEIYG